jgi:TetR/AcrR family transcriptional regulator
MSDQRVDRILDAAYACFVRHGVRRTTMDDIAAAAEMSRPAVYQYVRNKDDAFRRLASRLFDGALARAEAAAASGSLVDRLHGVLSVKLELTLKLWSESPHAAELLDESARLSGDLVEAFKQSVLQLLVDAIRDSGVNADPLDLAEIAMALNVGLEADLSDPDRPRRRLRQGLELLVAGLSAPGDPAA